jgi:hypothetical protein
MMQPVTDELLAALLDGRLDPGQRAALLARLAGGGADDEDVAVLADTAALLAAIEEEEAAADRTLIAPAPTVASAVPPAPAAPPVLVALPPSEAVQAPPGTGAEARARRAWTGPPKRWLAMAAVLAAVALTPLLVSRARAPGMNDPARPAALLAAGLPAGWTENRAWATRGGPDISETAAAVRLGAYHVDRELAVRARDTAAIAKLAGQMEYLLGSLTVGGSVAADYREIGEHPAAPARELAGALRRGREGLLLVADPDLVGVGSWSEAGLLAAARKDAAFFRDRRTRAALERAAGLPQLEEPARAALARIRALLRAGDAAPDWNALAEAFTDLQRATAR